MLIMERWKFVFYAATAFLLMPVFWLITFWRRAHFIKSNRPRILVIPIMTRVGDLVCATPVFRAIKIHRPSAELSVLVGKKAIGIIKNNHRIDHLININDESFKGFWGRGRLFRFLARQKFDYVVSLTNNPFNNLAAFYSFAPERVKTIAQERTLTENLTDWFNNRRLVYRDHAFLQSHYLKLLEFLGIKENEAVQEVFISADGEEKADSWLKNYGLSAADRLIGISITAGNKIKEWGDEKFAAVAKSLAEHYNVKIIFLGAKGDEARIDAVLAKLVAKNFFKAVNFSLEELPSLIKRLNLLIAVDTGPVYIAHALKVPLIDIIGPVDPEEQPPNDKISIQVRPPARIKPSSFVIKRPGQSREHQKAIEAISVKDVLTAAVRLL